MIFGACQIDKIKPENPDSMPNYDLVFNNNTLDEISISVVPKDWKALQDNLSLVIQNENIATEKSGKKLLTVPALVRFKGDVWNKVGLKYHNSFNLIEGIKIGQPNLPIELDFDYYEDTFSELKDQKFHGFSNLILDIQPDDESIIRQILQNKLLEELKINTTKNSLKKVKLSIGNQNQIVIYTLKEKIDSDMIKNKLNLNNFNLYSTSSSLRKFVINDFNRLENSYLPGFGDVQRLINAVNGRNSIYNVQYNPVAEIATSTWKTSLEFAYDNKMYIRWLALNTVIGNSRFNELQNEPYFIFSSAEKNANIIYTFPHKSFGLGLEPNFSNDELLQFNESNPLLSNIINDPGYFKDFQTEIITIKKDYFTTAYLFPIIDRYYNQMRIANSENLPSNVPQLEQIEELKRWIKLRIDNLNTSDNEMSVIL